MIELWPSGLDKVPERLLRYLHPTVSGLRETSLVALV